MAPRITLLSSAIGNSVSRTWSAPEQAASKAEPAGTGVQMDVDQDEELSEMDERSMQEIDELDDSDDGAQDAQPQWETISSASTGAASPKTGVKRQRAKPPTNRIPGQTIVPVSRIEAIVSADVAQNGIHSKEAAYLISLATEEFIRRLTRVGHSRSRLDKRSLTTYNDIADTTYYFEEYRFLQEMIPRPLSPKTALAERKRIMDERDALLNGLNISSADNDSKNKIKLGQTSASASTSKASTPVPRLSKSRNTSNTTANGRTSSKAKGVSATTTAPLVRSERQRNKKARIEQEASASEELHANGALAPPPTPAPNGSASMDVVVVNGSSNTSRSGSVKIKIRPRVASATSSAVNPSPPPSVLSLAPPTEPSTATLHEREDTKRPRSHLHVHNGEYTDLSLKPEEDDKSEITRGKANGKSGNVQFAPMGVAVSDQPLWTRVPLPPPPSAKVSKSPTDSRPAHLVTDLDSVVEQARISMARKLSSGRDLEENNAGYARGRSETERTETKAERGEPISKRSRQRQRSGESAPGKGSLRDVLNGSLPNPGRTIYSER